MGFVRSVLGDIAPEELGICDCHDHLLRTSGPELNLNSWYCMDRVSAAKKEFEYYLEAGGKSMICMDPLGAGRDVPKMLELAERMVESGDAEYLIIKGRPVGRHPFRLTASSETWGDMYGHGELAKAISTFTATTIPAAE